MEKKQFAITLDQATALMYDEIFKVWESTKLFVIDCKVYDYKTEKGKENVSEYCSKLAESLVTLNDLRLLFLKQNDAR